MIYKTILENEFFTRERCGIIEIFNSRDFHDLSIARARVAPGVTTEKHRLSTDEAYYILRGRGTVEIDSKRSDVAEGDVVFITSGQIQSIQNNEGEDLIFLCICTPRFTQDAYETAE